MDVCTCSALGKQFVGGIDARRRLTVPQFEKLSDFCVHLRGFN